MTTKPEGDMLYAQAMHGHTTEREALVTLAAKVDRVSNVLSLIERLAGEQSEHPANRCQTVVLVAQLGGYYAAGIGGEIAALVEAMVRQEHQQ